MTKIHKVKQKKRNQCDFLETDENKLKAPIPPTHGNPCDKDVEPTLEESEVISFEEKRRDEQI